MIDKEIIKRNVFKKILLEFWESPLPQIFPRILEVPNEPKKITVIWGPRRSGKSFYLFNLVKKLWEQGVPKNQVVYLNFEDDRLPHLKAIDLQQLLEAYFELFPENKGKKLFFLLDEIQNITGWEAFARRLYEKEKTFVFITGSSSKLLSREIATALRGRCYSFALYPLSFKEFLSFKGIDFQKEAPFSHQRFVLKKELEEYLTWGRFPEVVLEKDPILKRKILQEYFQALLYQDLAERFTLTNAVFLEEFLKYLITNPTCLFSTNAYYKLVSQNIPISRDTVFSYSEKLAESFYFYYLPIFSYSLKVQRVNPKKIILLDNGLRQVAGMQFSQDFGKLAENLTGKFLLEQDNTYVYYWRNKHEVDFVVKKGKEVTALNVSYTDMISERETAGLKEFKKKFPKTDRLIILNKDITQVQEGIEFIPLWQYLLELIS